MKLVYLPRKIIIALITIYQKTISPDHGLLRYLYPHGYCRYYPTCSDYAQQAVQRFGVFKGGWMGLRRLLRCTPFHEGGVDNVPEV